LNEWVKSFIAPVITGVLTIVILWAGWLRDEGAETKTIDANRERIVATAQRLQTAEERIQDLRIKGAETEHVKRTLDSLLSQVSNVQQRLAAIETLLVEGSGQRKDMLRRLDELERRRVDNGTAKVIK